MENVKQINDVQTDEAVELTPQQEAFCLAFIEESNAACAYRRAYNVGERTLPQTVWANASRLLADSKVAARVAFLRERLAKQTICGVIDLMRDWYDIATADPTELVRVNRYNCRNCNGIDFKYQWRDIEEWTDACVEACAAAKKNADPVMPDFSGGVGFNARAVPNAICPCCHGEGREHTYVADTSKVSTKARKLIKSVSQDRYGVITIEMKDQQKALESLARCLGAFNDKLILPKTPGSGDAKTIDEGVSPQDAARAYQAMLNG